MSHEILTTAEMSRRTPCGGAWRAVFEPDGECGPRGDRCDRGPLQPCAVTVLCGPGNNGGDGLWWRGCWTRKVSLSASLMTLTTKATRGDVGALKGARLALTPMRWTVRNWWWTGCSALGSHARWKGLTPRCRSLE